MIKNTTHYSFNIVHHRLNTHVESSPGFDQGGNDCIMNKLMLTM